MRGDADEFAEMIHRAQMGRASERRSAGRLRV